ncbi:MAG TPA: PhoH family protein [Chthoniobacteraceae bacterium]|nr:PhoH family protein [Chthoniobacteraceae bacterium]
MNQFDSHQHIPQTLETQNQQGLFGHIGEVEAPPRARRKKLKQSRTLPLTGKNYVLDTNVLLHDPASIHRFADNHLWIPVDVLSELDKFKGEQSSDRGANARAVHRELSRIFSGQPGAVTTGAPTEGGGTIRIAINDPAAKNKSPGIARFQQLFPDTARVDHRIIETVLLIQETHPELPAVLVTKDLNMQLKALAVGVPCEDYLNDKVEAKDVESYDLRCIEVTPHELQRFASSGELELEEARIAGLAYNEYVLLRADERKTMPARFFAGQKFKRLQVPDSLHIPRGLDIHPANLGQQCLIDALLDPSISLVTCYGQAGTGKTLLAVAAGLHCVFARQYYGLTVSRPVVAMGDTLGFLPGSLEEKMRPWLQPIYDAFEVLMPPPGLHANGNGHAHQQQGKSKRKKHGGALQQPPPHHNGGNGNGNGAPAVRRPHELLIEQGLVEIEALCYIRGRSIPRRFFVLDESQQLTPLEAKTIVTRMSKGSKLVLIGDPGQIDNPYVDSRSNGLVYTRNRLKGQPITAHICLNKGERSPLAEVGAKLM